jgi:hypothetical protein
MPGKVTVVIGPGYGYILIKRPFSGEYRAVCSIIVRCVCGKKIFRTSDIVSGNVGAGRLCGGRQGR